MDEKSSLAYIQQEVGCLQHERKDLTGSTRSTTFFSPKGTIIILLLLCIIICFLSLSAVFVLAVKVQMLESRLDELCKQRGTADDTRNRPIDKLTEPTEKPSSLGSKNEEAKSGNITEEGNRAQPHPWIPRGNRTWHGKRRVSRTTNGGGSNSGGSTSGQQGHQHSFTHLTGFVANIQCGDRWVSWHTHDDAGYQVLSTDLLSVVFNTFIRIYQPGYYYVYGQLTYNTQASGTFGYEMVRSPLCSGNPTVLLRTKTTLYQRIVYQQMVPSEDSAYIGGVFYFDYLDEIGIRKEESSISLRVSNTPDTYNYFGAILLFPDLGASLSPTCSGNPHPHCTADVN